MRIPDCDVCGGPVPRDHWTDEDERAEQEEMVRTGNPHRPLYCSVYPCMDKARQGILKKEAE